MSVETKIDNLTEIMKSHTQKLDCVDDKIKQITTVLGGSGLGEKGLIEQFNSYKDSHHKLKRKVRDQNVANKAITGAVGTGVVLWEWFKKMFIILIIIGCAPKEKADVDAEFQRAVDKVKKDTVEIIGELPSE